MDATTTLRNLLDANAVTMADVAKRAAVSRSTVSRFVNLHQFPVDELARTAIAQAITQELLDAGAQAQRVKRTIDLHLQKEQSDQHQSADRSADRASANARIPTTNAKDPNMLPPKQNLSDAARRAFGLVRSPFVADIETAQDIFKTPQIRYLTESLWQAAKHPSFVAVVGESGSGKTTVGDEFKDRVQREARNCIVIEPSVLYMEQNDKTGKTLKSAQIIAAIMSSVSPGATPKREIEARDRQVRQLLSDGRRAGQRFVLLIEEAHCLPTPTLKHLKRFTEVKDGMTQLLSIVLFAQPELLDRLHSGNRDLREVAQRLDILQLHPLDNDLEAYIKFKLQRVGVDIANVFAPGAIDALRARLAYGKRTSTANGKPATAAVSLSYPLAVANTVVAAMNLAAELGADKVDASIIKDI